jgi:hypothetical protein
LRRALVLAGTQSQLVSLWKVDDQATQELMVDYYRRLLKGGGRSESLRAAQRAMMAKPARRHPYYWAIFIQIGDWAHLSPEHSTFAPGKSPAGIRIACPLLLTVLVVAVWQRYRRTRPSPR